MTAAITDRLALSEDQLLVVAQRLGVNGLPTVRDVRPRHTTVDRRDAAFDVATRDLVARNLILDGTVDLELADLLHVLERPDRELAMRLVTPDGPARVSLVRRNRLCVLARRVGYDITLRVLGHDVDVREATSALVSELPQAPQADIQPIGAPLDAMSEALGNSHDPSVIADRVRALGAETRAAMLLGSALGTRQAFAEIVYNALVEDSDRIYKAPAAVAVLYTKRGRIVGAPSSSPSGQLWTTLKAGSDHAVNQAISQLIELSTERWGVS